MHVISDKKGPLDKTNEIQTTALFAEEVPLAVREAQTRFLQIPWNYFSALFQSELDTCHGHRIK